MAIVEANSYGPLLLDIGIVLLRSGASNSKIRQTMTRLAAAHDFELHLDIGPKFISLSLHSLDDKELFHGTKSAPVQGVNFEVISGISQMSWAVTEDKWSTAEIRTELTHLLNLSHYHRLVILFFVSVAGSAFCYTFGGNATEMMLTFGATFSALYAKQELVKRSYNNYFCTYLSSLVAACFAACFFKAGTWVQLDHAFATSVLFLIPGVPLINSVTDLFNGEIISGIEKGFNALIHVFAIASGLATIILTFNL